MRQLLSALALLAWVAVGHAADKPNLSGSWKMNASKSDFGQLPSPDSFLRKVEHAEPSITIIEEQSGPGTTPTTTRKMLTDSKGVMAEINGAPVQLSAMLEGAALVVATSLEGFGLKFVDKMSLSSDGKELTSVVQIESGQGNAQIKVVFDRQ